MNLFPIVLVICLIIAGGLPSVYIYDRIYWWLVEREVDKALEAAEDLIKLLEEMSNV